ncbi:MAG: RNA polymerase factor sigma-54 [Rickettsiaceae bacterium]
MKQKLQQNIHLKQTMNQHMHQSLKILQMSGLDLREYVTQILEKNPFLEENSNGNSNIQEENHNLYHSHYNARTSNNKSDFDHLSFIINPKDIREYLSEQINIAFKDNTQRSIAYSILELMQEDGYIKSSVDKIVEQLKCSEDLVYKILNKLQRFDPPGVFARNLQECLSIQLSLQSDELNSAMKTLLDNLHLLAEHKLTKLQTLCDVDSKTLFQMIKKIRKLNPKPTSAFINEYITYKIPDLTLHIDYDDLKFKLSINHKTLPNLRLNNELYKKAKLTLKNQEDYDFTDNELNNAKNIIKSLKHRMQTIFLVGEVIVKEQFDFFIYGVMHIKPLTLNRIAQITGLNESTISRATANKYIDTPRGIYELKYFFSSNLDNHNNRDKGLSSTKIKELIKQMILGETKEEILSDNEIANELQKLNIHIARRTVAKYRMMNKIPSSNIRKKHIDTKVID